MVEIKTLEQAYEVGAGSQVTAQMLLNGRMKVNGSWESVDVQELKPVIADIIVNRLGGKADTRRRVLSVLLYGRPQHWGLNRFIVSKYEDKVVLEYCAGQEQTREFAELRNHLKK